MHSAEIAVGYSIKVPCTSQQIIFSLEFGFVLVVRQTARRSGLDHPLSIIPRRASPFIMAPRSKLCEGKLCQFDQFTKGYVPMSLCLLNFIEAAFIENFFR